MTSFYYASTPTRGNCFQTKQKDYDSDDCAGDRVTSVCVTNEKDVAFQRQIWSTFVSVLLCIKTKIPDGNGEWDIGSC